MTAFHHSFGRTVLRKYDICGIVGKTLQLEDAFAIGCCFGSMVARAGGSKVTVGYDGLCCSWPSSSRHSYIMRPVPRR